MGLFFNYDNSVCSEGTTPVVFSFDPSISSLKELLIYELSQLSYHEFKLRELGEDTEDLTNDIIENITLALVNLDFRKDEFLNMLKVLYEGVERAKEEYKNSCERHGCDCEILIGEKLSFESKKEGIKAVNFGEKQSLMKNTVFSKKKKMLSDIAIMLVCNASLCITEIESYSESVGDLKYKIPELLKTINYDDLSDAELKNKILNFAKSNSEIMQKLNEIIVKKYGPVEMTDVELNIKKGKCILVSGHYFKDLELLLEAVKDEDINVYTHNEMLFAHSFKGFQKYKNLAGHYQRSANNLQLDFASFPGAVLITKNSHPHMDMIRGRVFTSNDNVTYGVGKVNENNFAPLIQAAKEESGFKRDIKIDEITVGYNQNEIITKLSNIVSKIQTNKIKQLFIIGLNNYSLIQNAYFEKFFEILPDDCYTISFSYNTHKRNVWHINTYYDMSLAYLMFNELAKYPKILHDKTTVFMTQCHLQTIAHTFNLKILGVKNIFIGECCSSIINPSVLDGMTDLFGIKQLSNSPKRDIRHILKKSK